MNKVKTEQFINPNVNLVRHRSFNQIKPQAKNFIKVSLKKRLLITFLVLLIVLVAIFFLLKKNPLKFKNIVFKNSDLSCVSNPQISKTANLQNANFLTFNSKDAQKRLKDRFLCLESIEFKPTFPQTLEVSAHQRQGVAYLKTFVFKPLDLELEEATSSTKEAKVVEEKLGDTPQGGVFLVDQSGIVIEVVTEFKNQNLPIFNYYGREVKVGVALPNNLIKNSLDILHKLNEFSIPPQQVTLIRNEFIAEGVPTIKLSLLKDIDRQLASLQLILQQSRMDSKTVISVDLRFDKTVVVYSSAKK